MIHDAKEVIVDLLQEVSTIKIVFSDYDTNK